MTDKAGLCYKANAQAILYSYFSSLITYPMYVHNQVSVLTKRLSPIVFCQNAIDATNFVELSLELGGFPLVDPIFEDNTSISAVLQLCNLQKILMKVNSFSYRENILHLLA